MTLHTSMELLIDSTAKNSPYVLRKRLLQRFATAWEDTHERMKMAQRRYKGDHREQTHNAAQPLYAGSMCTLMARQWQPLLQLANRSKCKLMSPKIDQFKNVKMSLSTLSVDEYGISSTVSIVRATPMPTQIIVQKVLKNVKSGNEAYDRLAQWKRTYTGHL